MGSPGATPYGAREGLACGKSTHQYIILTLTRLIPSLRAAQIELPTGWEREENGTGRLHFSPSST